MLKTAVCLIIGMLAAPAFADDSGKASAVSTTHIEGAVQMFLIQRQMRLSQFEQAMGQVGPYLRDGLTGIESREQLLALKR